MTQQKPSRCSPTPRKRLEAIRTLSEAGIPCGVLMAPLIPGLTDHEIPAVLEAAAEAGARSAGFVMLRLPGAVEGLFQSWLEEHLPERKEKVLNRLRTMRGGRLNDPRFGHRMRGQGVFAEQIKTFFETSRRRLGLAARGTELSTDAFRRPRSTRERRQLALFDS